MPTPFQPISYKLFDKVKHIEPKFGWYQVGKIDGPVYIALLSDYGVIYVQSSGETTYSSREYFDQNYKIFKELDLKVTIQEAE